MFSKCPLEIIHNILRIISYEEVINYCLSGAISIYKDHFFWLSKLDYDMSYVMDNERSSYHLSM